MQASERTRGLSLRTLAAIVCYGAGFSMLAVVVILAASKSYALERELFFLRASGWSALAALLGALCASPIARILKYFTKAPFPVGPFRRALGITAAVLASIHAAAALTTYLARSLAHILDIAWIRDGVVAWAILLLLLLTSYPRIVRALRIELWKPLHRLAYAAAFFVFLHTILSPLAARALVLAVFGLAVSVGLARFLPSRASKSSGNDEDPSAG